MQVHWRLCEKHDFEGASQWYKHKPDGIIKNEVHKILWDFTIQRDIKIDAQQPYIVIIEKNKKEVKIVNVTIPGDVLVTEREVGKIEKYKILKEGITRMWKMKKVTVIPVAVEALGSISTGFKKYVTAIGIEMKVANAQKTALLGTARILRLLLGC